MILPSETAAGSAGMQPCRRIAWCAHRDDHCICANILPALLPTRIGSDPRKRSVSAWKPSVARFGAASSLPLHSRAICTSRAKRSLNGARVGKTGPGEVCEVVHDVPTGSVRKLVQEFQPKKARHPAVLFEQRSRMPPEKLWDRLFVTRNSATKQLSKPL